MNRMIKAFAVSFFCTFFALANLCSVFGRDESKSVSSYSLWLKDFRINNGYFSNELTFEIRIINNGNSEIEYAGGRYIINFYSPVANGGILTYSITGPDTSVLPQYLRPMNPQIQIDGDTSQLILESNVFPGAGSGFFIPPDLVGKRVIKMKLRTTATSFLIYNGPIGYNVELYPEWRNPPLENSTTVYAYLDQRLKNITSNQNHFIDGIGLTPVELISFTSEVNANVVSLKWATERESNNLRFDIERKSQPIDEWLVSGFVLGNGTVNEIRNYSFTEVLNTGNHKYRLKQIDYNGKYEYFYLNQDVTVGAPE